MRRLIRKLTILTLLCLLFCFISRAQAPVADFSAVTASGCSPLVVNFSDASTGNPTIWFWDFGNGATSTLKNPSTTYFIPGRYTVTLTVTNASGVNTKVQQDYVVVYGKPIVLFAGNDSIGCYPFPVSFTDLSLPSVGTTNTAWIWDFGDGTQATTQNPQNTYLQTGNYTVTLKVTNDKGCFSTFTKSSYIRLNGGVKPDFSFTQPAVCRTPITVSFSNQSTGPGTLSYQWIFGDNSTSTQQNPSHTYTSPGVYGVSLVTISSVGCRDTIKKDNLFNFNDITTSFTAPDSVCAGELVSFLNTSSSTPTQTMWSFGDGTTSTAINGSKSYTTAGDYTIKLQQTYGTCTDSASKKINVKPRPKALFVPDRRQFCQTPATVNFANNSQSAISYQWNFGDGNTSTQEAPSHTFTSYGTFIVKLVATSDNGCTDSMNQTIVVTKPVISIPGFPREDCIPYTIDFSASVTSPEPIVSYEWNFGNGVTATNPTPSYTYTTPGTYTISLTVKTASGCTETVTLPEAVKVGTKPTVNFSATPREVCAFKTVTFTNLTSGTVPGAEYYWLFGDGGTSTNENPVYQYGDTGIFDVILWVKNNGCRDSFAINDYITVKPPIASFIWQANCSQRLNYKFTDQSIGATSWLWDFGDGNTSTQKNPTHSYTAYGTYVVKLVVSNDTCSHEQLQTIQIVNGTPDFKALPTVACKGATINFEADTTNAANIVSYRWNFGHNGNPGSGMTPSTVYSKPGLYSVTLVVTDVAGCKDSVVKPNYIKITGPTAGFITTGNNGCRGITTSFSDTSKSDGISNIVQWQWNLGDGTLINDSISRAIQHVYGQAGSFSVSLKVTDSGGCMDSIVKPALVNISNIKADFISVDTLSCPGATINFSNRSVASSAFTNTWQFGNSTTSTQQNPTTTYAANGTYTVKLIIRDAVGCTDSLIKPQYISINSPVASFTVSDSATSCTPFQVRFTNTSTYYNSYMWDLAGGTSTLPNPTQYYNQAGIYHTKLIITSPGGCSDTAERTLTVNDVSGAQLDYLPLNGCRPLTVDLNAIAPKNMSYVWDFGDGTIINSQDTVTQHVYNFFGDFVPKLILMDGSGCVIPVTGPDTIRIIGATTKFAVDNRILCDSGLVRFFDSTSFNDPIISYEWNFGDGTTSNLSNVTHYYSQPGIYPVSVNVLTQNNCVDTFRLNVPVKVVPSPSIRIGGDTVICVGDGINHLGEFNRFDTSVVRWAWSFPNGNTAEVQLPQRQLYKTAGDFVVRTIATNSDGCKDTATKNIKVHPLPTVQLPSTLTTRTGTSVQLPAIYSSGVVSYNWTHPESLNCNTCPQPVSSPKMNTQYVVEFVDSNSCRNTGQVQVIVFCDNDNVFVPNTFSPNGDGSNDVFYVRGKGLNRVKSLRVFNRWGQVVFEKLNFAVNDASAGWNGTYNGAKPVADVYVYQLEMWCDNATIVKFEGNIALIQ